MRRTRLFGRLAIVLVLALAIAPLWAIAAELLLGVKDRPQYLKFMRDGTPFLFSWRTNGRGWHCEDLSGSTIDVDVNDSLYVSNLPGPDDQIRAKPSRRWSDRIAVFFDGQRPPGDWSLISDGLPDGHAYFVGFDSISMTRLGFLGVDGFRATQPTEKKSIPFAGGERAFERNVEFGAGGYLASDVFGHAYTFAEPPVDSRTHFDRARVYLVGSDHRLHLADLRHRTTSVVSDDLQVVSVGRSYIFKPDERTSDEWLALRTDREIAVLDNRHKIVRRYVIPTEVPGGEIEWSEIAPGRAIIYWTTPNPSLTTKVTQIIWLDEAGQVARHESATLPSRQFPPLRIAADAPSPLEIAAALMIQSWESLSNGADGWPAAFSFVWANTWLDVVAVLILAVLLSAICYRRETHYATSPVERVLWPLLVLVGGVPVWLGYRFSRRWPVLEACPKCHARVPRDRAACARCGSDFPRPELQGTEVLSP